MRIFTAALAVLLMASGCGGSSDSATPTATAAPTTTAPPTTTPAPTTTDLFERFNVARASHSLYGDLTFPTCTIGVVGAARTLSFINEDPDAEELLLLENCIIAYEEKAAADPWGKQIEQPPQLFYASDVAPQAKELIEEALFAATEEWGNYGPLEYWVAGIDVDAATELADQFCTRWLDRFGDKQDCLENEHVAKFLPEQAAAVAKAALELQCTSNAGRNGMRAWNIHLFSSSYPMGFAEICDGGSYASDQTTVFHEYFHAVQHAFIYTFDRDKRWNEFGVQNTANWFGEGGAEWMAQTAVQRLREAGELTASDWNSFPDRMTDKMTFLSDWQKNNPEKRANEIPPHGMNNVGYDYGTWAHAYLSNLVGPDALLEVFYPNLNELGHEGAFLKTYGMTMSDFIVEFDRFVLLPIEEQLRILPKFAEN